MSLSPPAQKVKFAHLLRAELKRQGIQQHDAAGWARMPPTTFRTRLARNNFSPREGQAVAAALKWPLPDKAEADYGERWKDTDGGLEAEGVSLAQLIRVVDRQRKALDLQQDRLAARLPDLIKAMGKGDLSISASATVTPLEFERDADEELTNAIASAVKHEATFVYLRPEPDFLKQLINTWHFDKVPGPDDIERELQWFRQRLAASLQGKYGEPPDRARQLVLDHVLQFSVPDSPFWAAGFTMGMFCTVDRDRSAVRRMIVRLPGPHRRALLQPANYDRFASRFTTFVIESLRQVLKPAEPVKKVRKGSRNLQPNTDVNPEILKRIIDQMEQGGAFT